MTLFKTGYEQRPPHFRHNAFLPQAESRPVVWMENLGERCLPNLIHAFAVPMVHIATRQHYKYGFMYVYACPVCNRREGWIIGWDGRPFRLWRGKPATY